MPKALLAFLALVLGPFVLVAVVALACVAIPCACLYFTFSRLCDCIEELRPRRPGVKRKRKGFDPASLGKLLSSLPARGKSTTDNSSRRHVATEPALPS